MILIFYALSQFSLIIIVRYSPTMPPCDSLFSVVLVMKSSQRLNQLIGVNIIGVFLFMLTLGVLSLTYEHMSFQRGRQLILLP